MATTFLNLPKGIKFLSGELLQQLVVAMFSDPSLLRHEVYFKKTDLTVGTASLRFRMASSELPKQDQLRELPGYTGFMYRSMVVRISFEEKKLVFEPAPGYITTTANNLRANVITNQGKLLLLKLPHGFMNGTLDYNTRLINQFMQDARFVQRIVLLGNRATVFPFLRRLPRTIYASVSFFIYIANANETKKRQVGLRNYFYYQKHLEEIEAGLLQAHPNLEIISLS